MYFQTKLVNWEMQEQEKEEQEDKNKHIRPRERTRGQKKKSLWLNSKNLYLIQLWNIFSVLLAAFIVVKLEHQSIQIFLKTLYFSSLLWFF